MKYGSYCDDIVSASNTRSGEASSDELVMQNSLRMRKYDRVCAMQSCSKSMSYQPALTGYINASIYDYYLLFRCSVELSTIAKAN